MSVSNPSSANTSIDVAVFGAGSWGTALARLLAANGHRVVLWTRNSKRAQILQRDRVNTPYLPGYPLPPSISVTSRIDEALRCPWLVLSVPSKHLPHFWTSIVPGLSPTHRVLNTAKGLDHEQQGTLSHMLSRLGGPHGDLQRMAVLSGPNHAEEVAAGLPTASVVASPSVDVAQLWQQWLMGPGFRVYTSDDVLGVELGGALKNVIALAAGMADGLGFGDNTKATIVTRGLAEMTRLGVAMGASPLTFSGLSGIGDLVATCTSSHSRNARAGKTIGEGVPPSQVIENMKPMVIEGVATSLAARDLATEFQTDMPITAAVCRVLYEGKRPLDAMRSLMERDPKAEWHTLNVPPFP